MCAHVSHMRVLPLTITHTQAVALPILAMLSPLASIGYILDGLTMGAADFTYMMLAMVVAATVTVTFIYITSLPSMEGVWAVLDGLQGIWASFGLLIAMRVTTLGLRIHSGGGPWTERSDSNLKRE